MRMPGLLLVPLAMVAFVSAGQARPSAPSTAADDVRELGKSIEQIHPDPFRSVSRQRFESRGERARAARAGALAGRAPRRRHADRGAPRPAERAHGALPRRPVPYARAPSVPAPAVRVHGRAVRRRRDRRARSSRSRLVAIEGMPIETALDSSRAARPTRQPLEPPRARPALPAHRRGARRPRDRRRRSDPPRSRSSGRAGNASTSRSRRSRRRATSRRSRIALYGHYPSILPRASRPLYLSGSAQADVGADARRRARGLRRVQRRPGSDAGVPAEAHAPRARREGPPRRSSTSGSTEAGTTRRTARSRRSSALRP